MKKYKLTLLKDLPDRKAGTEVLNISEDELLGIVPYEYRYCIAEQNFSDIFNLRNNPEWVKIEEDNRCDCLTRNKIKIRDVVIDYGRSLRISLDFKNKQIFTWYDHAYECGTSKNLPIKFCPLCGRKL